MTKYDEITKIMWYNTVTKVLEDNMGLFEIILLVIAFLLISGGAAMLIYTLPIARNVYKTQLVRTSKEKWGRVCSAPENEEQLELRGM